MRTFEYISFKEAVEFAKNPMIKKPFKGSLEIEEVIFGENESLNKTKFLCSWIHKFTENQQQFLSKTVKKNI
jgi:hypothetical protein